MSAKYKRIPVDDLLLDDQNPRLPSHLRGASEGRIIEYMLLEASTLELMQAIGENNFFEGEQLLVVDAGKGRFKVIEGNRRLVSVKLLREPQLATAQQTKVQRVFDEARYKLDQLDELPCLVFEDENLIHRYVGFRHITGIEPWNLRQRASYLSSLREAMFNEVPLNQACRELAKIIGSRRDYVKRILVGQSIYRTIAELRFFSIKGLDEETFYFNYIADSLSRSNIAEYLGVDLESDDPLQNLRLAKLENWTRWFFEKFGENQTRLKGKSQDLTMLNAVLAHETALKAFEEDGCSLKESFELTADIQEIFSTAVARAVSELEQADSLTHKLTSFYSGLEEDLGRIVRLTRKIRDARDAQLASELKDDEL